MQIWTGLNVKGMPIIVTVLVGMVMLKTGMMLGRQDAAVLVVMDLVHVELQFVRRIQHCFINSL